MKEERGKKEAMGGKIEIISEGEFMSEVSPDINSWLCCATCLTAFR